MPFGICICIRLDKYSHIVHRYDHANYARWGATLYIAQMNRLPMEVLQQFQQGNWVGKGSDGIYVDPDQNQGWLTLMVRGIEEEELWGSQKHPGHSSMCHGQTFCIIYNAIFNYQFDLFYCARRAGATGRKCTMTINARHASGCGLVAIFGIIVWESAPVFVSRWSGGYFIPIPSMFGHVGCIALS